jgi:hypothetical protein
MISKVNYFVWIVAAFLYCTGFRVYNEKHPWKEVNNNSAATAKVFVIYERASDSLNNDLPDHDPLAGTSSITVEQAMDSVFDDYNSIQASFITLVDNADSDYSSAAAERRTIRIYNESAGGLNGGRATLVVDDDGVKGCDISLIDSAYENAKAYIAVVTHEIGHCMGLDHPQEITWSIMSYFHGDSVYRLQTDDKMGMVYLYPSDPDKAKEEPTFGLACSRKE